MPKPFTPKVITANALLEGDVVYQTATGWTRSLSEAEGLTDEADADLRLIDALSQQELVVGVYPADSQRTKRPSNGRLTGTDTAC